MVRLQRIVVYVVPLHLYSFNSNMVRLQPDMGIGGTQLVTAFQFQYGAITATYFGDSQHSILTFQFQYGAITA